MGFRPQNPREISRLEKSRESFRAKRFGTAQAARPPPPASGFGAARRGTRLLASPPDARDLPRPPHSPRAALLHRSRPCGGGVSFEYLSTRERQQVTRQQVTSPLTKERQQVTSPAYPPHSRSAPPPALPLPRRCRPCWSSKGSRQTAAERTEIVLEGFKDFHLKAKVKIWP